MSLAWPDIIIGAVLLIATLKGYKRGFVSELSGAIALVLSLITPWYYNGAFDATLEAALRLGPGSAHVIGMFLTGIATYAVVLLLAWALNAVAKLPILGFGNALFGAAVGFVKGAILLWLILYVVLFFPLSRDIRADLHRSSLVGYVISPNARIDSAISGVLPWFARPFARPFLARHRV
ncbi:MAG: CvpA family protein [Candidatus Eremiobacteraeota bacterium]|nr:CvpA family protein [Candidatus Eremiobacteraeota bacterium]